MSRELDYDWVSDQYLEQIKTETELMRIPHRQLAETIMTEALPLVAHRLVHIATKHPDPVIAMKAINNIMDRTMGRPKISQEINLSSSPQESLHEKMMAEIQVLLAEN